MRTREQIIDEIEKIEIRLEYFCSNPKTIKYKKREIKNLYKELEEINSKQEVIKNNRTEVKTFGNYLFAFVVALVVVNVLRVIFNF